LSWIEPVPECISFYSANHKKLKLRDIPIPQRNALQNKTWPDMHLDPNEIGRSAAADADNRV
jgi:hypothetical protein